ncbi:hypothetical protein L7F22_007391 [Adiantum nelumboides]|nr:hypothetical protein [Adiantum nelumboides]
MTTKAEPFTKVKFVGGNKCGDQDSKVLGHAEKEDVLDKEAKPDAEVEIVGAYNCEEHHPEVEVHVDKEGMLEKDSPKNGDQVENCPSMKDNEVSARDSSPSILQTIQMMQRGRKRRMTSVNYGVAFSLRKPREDVEGQTKTSKEQVEKEMGENSNMESERKDAATSNIDHLDHIISMIAKSTMKDPLDVDTSFRVEGHVPCASNIEDQEDKHTEFFVFNIGGAVGVGEDMEIISKKSKPPQENGDASVDASGDAICAGGVVGAGGAGEDTAKPPQENGDASMDASCGGGAIGAGGAGEDMEIITEKYEPPQDNGDPSVDASGDASCAGGAVGASVVEYVRHNDGMVPHPWEDGGDARGVAGYVRNNDGMVSCPWEDPSNILFESKLTIILDINGVLLTSVNKRYCSQMPAYCSGLKIVDKAGVFAGYKRDAPAFLD